MTRRSQKDTHDHVAELIERCFGATGGELTVGGVSIGEIAATYGTPAFVYCRDALDRTWQSRRLTPAEH